MSTTEPIRNKTDLQKFMNYYAAIQPNPRNQALILLGLYTALRIGDILQLKWRMVYDFNKHHFFDHIYVNEQKTQKLNVIALNQHVKASLIVYFEIRNPEPEDYIFTKRTTPQRPINRSQAEASKKQAAGLNFTERQAQAILEMRLYKLIGLEILALQKEYEECLEKIAKYERILGSKKEMAKVIKADLLKIKKEYALPRKTQIEDAKAVVLEEKKMQEQEVMFIMDRFGYAKTIDMSAYERNKEAVHNENRYVFSCMNTDKICIFTDNGSLHQIKVLDIPFTRFRDKGTPIDNLGNYDSSGENILYLTPFEQLKGKKMLFMTKLGMAKLVDTSEFEVSKRTVAATKLQEDDLLVGIYVTDAVKEVFSRFSLDGEVKEEEMIVSSQHVIVQTADGYFLRFPLSDVPEKKKGAVGVRAIKLTGKDTVEDVYLLTQGDELTIEYRGKNVDFARLKMAHRDTKGTKIRV